MLGGLRHSVLSLLARTVYFSGRTFGVPPMRYFCPVCEQKVFRWQPFVRDMGGGQYRLEPERRLCPYCGSFERTRQFALYLRRRQLLERSPRFLHFAPERGLEAMLRPALGERYLTTDLSAQGVDLKQDITALTLDDDSFDFIYCSNVLEHVEDDLTAMRELCRVLKPGGEALIQVPIRQGSTYEDPSITDPAQRAIHFGQADHLRFYGRDIAERLEKAGFQVEELYMPNALGLEQEAVARMNLGKGELVHRCVKPPAGAASPASGGPVTA